MPTEQTTTMSIRERFNRVLHWQKPDRVPNMDFGYWPEIYETWHQQGLPAEITNDVQVEKYLGLEGLEQIPWVPANLGMLPHFEFKVLEEKGDHIIVQDHEGVISERHKHSASIPRMLKHALETKDDWEVFKREHLVIEQPERIGDVKAAVEAAHAAGMPIRFNGGSIYGWLRNWMGVENLSIAVIEEPMWVEEMMEHLTNLSLWVIERAFADKPEVDVAWWWEDMCYNCGPLLSPKHFKQMMVPRYKRITRELKKHGIDVNVLDCDGQIYALAPLWLEAGINCMFPLEAAHTDPLKIRETFGESMPLIGGVNKIELAKGKDAIDRELERLHPMVQQGGFIPTVDHRCPPDVSWDNYCYYVEKKKEIL
jgi:hypothetical protein